MKNKWYTLPLHAFIAASFFVFNIVSLIVFFNNDTIGGAGFLLILLFLFCVLVIPMVLFLTFCTGLWRIIWDWPSGRFILPVLFFFNSWAFGWNLYIFSDFLRPSQMVILFLSSAFFVFAGVLFAQRHSVLTNPDNFRGVYGYIFLGIMIIFLLSWITPVLQRQEHIDIQDYPTSDSESQMLFIGLDGASWNVQWPLHKMGKTPCISFLISSGCRGNLETFNPTSSPLIWTTIATGKGPFTHGIRDFGSYEIKLSGSSISQLPKGVGLLKIAAVAKKTGFWKFHPSSSMQRRSLTIWEILNLVGKTVNVCNWPVSIPVKPVKGSHVGETEYFQYHQIEPVNVLYPQLLIDEMQHEKNPAAELTETNQISPDVALAKRIENQSLAQWDGFLYHFNKFPAQLLLLYTHSLDLFEHLFWRYGMREEGNILDEGHPQLYQMIADHSSRLDKRVAGFLGSISGKQPYVCIASDHGFRTIYGFEKLINPSADRIQGVHDFSPEGVILFSGPDVKKNHIIHGSVFDIMPTLLDFFQLPLATDMPGISVLSQVIDDRKMPFYFSQKSDIVTYELKQKLQEQATPAHYSADKVVENKLKSLGYLE